MTYVLLRSHSDKHVHLLCRDGGFEALPDTVRHQGPWNVLQRGEIARLKLPYKVGLERDGYVLERTARLVPELPTFPEKQPKNGGPSDL